MECRLREFLVDGSQQFFGRFAGKTDVERDAQVVTVAYGLNNRFVSVVGREHLYAAVCFGMR